MLKKITDVLLKLDSTGPQPGFTYLGNSNQATFVGVAFTLTIFALSVTSVFEDSLNVINNKDPSITTFEEYNYTQSFGINEDTFNIFFTLKYLDDKSGMYKIVNLSEIEKASGQDIFPFLSYSQISSSKYVIQNITKLDYCNRTNPKMFVNYTDYLEYGRDTNLTQVEKDEVLSLKENSLCLPKHYSQLIFLNKSEGINVAVIFPDYFLKKFAYYKNSTNLFLAMYYQAFTYNTSPEYYFSKYYKTIWKVKTFFLDPYYRTISKALLRSNEIKKANNTAFERTYTDTVTSIETIFEYIKITTTEGLSKVSDAPLIIIFEMDQYMNKISIKYNTFLDIASSFGGLFSLLMSLFSLLESIFLDSVLSSNMLNHCFEFHENEVSDEYEINSAESNDSELVRGNKNKCKKVSHIIGNLQLKNLIAEKDRVKDIDTLTQSKKEECFIELKKSEDLNSSDGSSVKLKLIENNSIDKKEKDIEDLNNKEKDINFNLPPLGKEKKVISINDKTSIINLFKKRKDRVIMPTLILKKYFCEPRKEEEKIFSLIDYIEEAKDFTKYIKLKREVEMLKILILNKKQRSMFIPPSINVRSNEDDDETVFPLNSSIKDKDESGSEDLFQSCFGLTSFGKSYDEKRIEEVLSIDQNIKYNKKLLRSIVKSFI